MDCKHFEDSTIRLKTPVKSKVRLGRPEGKPCRSTIALSNTANNTSPIVCAVCGSKDYVTLHSPERNMNAFPPGCGSQEFLKKNALSTDFAPACAPLNPLTQAIFPQLSLFQFPSSIYYSHYNSNFRFPSSSCMPVEKYFGDSSMELNSSKAATVNSESTIYRESRDNSKKKSNTTRIRRENQEYKAMKDESRPVSAYGNVPEVKNYPFPMQPPWMGNMCPVFPYTYASLAFPVNQPMIPIYFPMPGRWPPSESRNEEETIGSSMSNSPMGDTVSLKNETEKKSETKDDTTSEYDLEMFARELMLEQKSNFDEDEEDEINLDEITSSLKITEANSGREINSEKFFNSKEKWIDSTKDGTAGKDEIQNWRLSSEINMQDCCIRTLSNENLWYEAQDGEKKNWDSIQDYECKTSSKVTNSGKHKKIETEQDNKQISGDGGSFYETNTVWQAQNRLKTPDGSKSRMNFKKSSEKSTRRQKSPFRESCELSSSSNDKRNDWSMSKNELSDEMEYSEDKDSSLAESTRLRDLNIINDNASKLDVRYDDYVEDIDCTVQTPHGSEKDKKPEGDYSLRMHTIQIEYSISTFADSHRREEAEPVKKNKKPGSSKMKIYDHDPPALDWDKINHILEKYNEKFDEIDVLLKMK
ncbi:UNVERIFIED_CONTAM: hypothetical protein PYX00_006264 [Menopon gallinae]|uniref:Uncharacterized protein n=1 Tax=Menopon gallinae TaxID=328185 RepID=A0AAW2HVJ1_9NEOP